MSLMEILVALTLLMIIILGTAPIMLQAYDGLYKAGEYTQNTYDAKTEIESRPFALTGDSFPKIIVRHDIRKRWYDDSGVLNIGVLDFLLDPDII